MARGAIQAEVHAANQIRDLLADWGFSIAGVQIVP